MIGDRVTEPEQHLPRTTRLGSSGQVTAHGLFLSLVLFLITFFSSACNRAAQSSGELHVTIKSDPKTFNPLMAEDDSSDIVRYLTGGVLIRVNRKTQEVEPDLAPSWNVDEDGRPIKFNLRSGLNFPDGAGFTPDDVVGTINAP